ncbi:DUF739 family protein [Acidaminococcus provencensis]|uniref:DUF739 family protein n=1 Tax=Acidaminococcus provencensis TaxID=2058289 RepID=UPI0022E7E615|nr:DUF739 family protein [Acidaminococcus provencensis]
MRFSYKKLKGRIKEIFGTQEKFAAAMGMSQRTVSLKLNNAVAWSQPEILLASKLLRISVAEIPIYFFTVVTQEIA